MRTSRSSGVLRPIQPTEYGILHRFRETPPQQTQGRWSGQAEGRINHLLHNGHSGREDPVQLERGNVTGVLDLERATGIEPALPAWKAGTLPLSYARKRQLS